MWWIYWLYPWRRWTTEYLHQYKVNCTRWTRVYQNSTQTNPNWIDYRDARLLPLHPCHMLPRFQLWWFSQTFYSTRPNIGLFSLPHSCEPGVHIILSNTIPNWLILVAEINHVVIVNNLKNDVVVEKIAFCRMYILQGSVSFSLYHNSFLILINDIYIF